MKSVVLLTNNFDLSVEDIKEMYNVDGPFKLSTNS